MFFNNPLFEEFLKMLAYVARSHDRRILILEKERAAMAKTLDDLRSALTQTEADLKALQNAQPVPPTPQDFTEEVNRVNNIDQAIKDLTPAPAPTPTPTPTPTTTTTPTATPTDGPLPLS